VEVNTMTKLARRPAAVVYDRVAGIYDLYTAPMEALGGRRARQRLFGRARGRILELGIGNGLSLPFYPPGAELTGIDISPRMLARARRRAHRMGLEADLEVADIEQLAYPDASFDTVTAACVFCSVGDPVRGLRETARVVRPAGLVLLYEHLRPRNSVLGKIADLVSPLTRRLFAPSSTGPPNATSKQLACASPRSAAAASGARSPPPQNARDRHQADHQEPAAGQDAGSVWVVQLPSGSRKAKETDCASPALPRS
jgi:ubiquinone/menaquinone biosynthesis C-methylase UbiE